MGRDGKLSVWADTVPAEKTEASRAAPSATIFFMASPLVAA
jgi:hypothetical protein